jgi:hypothetical protein
VTAKKQRSESFSKSLPKFCDLDPVKQHKIVASVRNNDGYPESIISSAG